MTTRTAVAAAIPLLSTLNSPGATFWMFTGTKRNAAAPAPGGRPVIGNDRFAGPGAVPGGIHKFICVFETYIKDVICAVPDESETYTTEISPSLVGQGNDADSVTVAKSFPYTRCQ